MHNPHFRIAFPWGTTCILMLLACKKQRHRNWCARWGQRSPLSPTAIQRNMISWRERPTSGCSRAKVDVVQNHEYVMTPSFIMRQSVWTENGPKMLTYAILVGPAELHDIVRMFLILVPGQVKPRVTVAAMKNGQSPSSNSKSCCKSQFGRRKSIFEQTPWRLRLETNSQHTKLLSGDFFFFPKRGKLHRLSLIHIWRCWRLLTCRSRWSPYH